MPLSLRQAIQFGARWFNQIVRPSPLILAGAFCSAEPCLFSYHLKPLNEDGL